MLNEIGEPQRRQHCGCGKDGPEFPSVSPLYNVAMPKLRVFLSHVTVESKLADVFRSHLLREFIGLVDVFESSDRLSIPAGSKC